MTNVKKIIILSVIVFIVGATIGIILTRNLSGILAGATGLLPAISLLGASNRSNNSVDRPDGSIRNGIDEITGAVGQSSEHITASKTRHRTAADILREAAKPIKMDNDRDDSSGNSHLDNNSN
jgi:hypothetical protein